MVKTKKKRKKVRKNTRVFRCVQKVKKTRKIGPAIAICQSSTKQNYRTGRRLKNKKTKKRGGKKKNRPSRNRYKRIDLLLRARAAERARAQQRAAQRARAAERARVAQQRAEEQARMSQENPEEGQKEIENPEEGQKEIENPEEHYQSSRGGSKSKKIKSLTKIFQQYPDIFPSGYFRFLGARLQNHIDKKTLWYKNGVILTWIKYQKTVKKTPKCIIKPGDVKLDQIVNKNQGNGAGKKVVLQFLKKFEKNRIWLEVRANNKRAIRFYRDRGFKKVCKIKFGEIPGIMMVKN
jgi:hypothetical protein